MIEMLLATDIEQSQDRKIAPTKTYLGSLLMHCENKKPAREKTWLDHTIYHHLIVNNIPSI